MNYFESFFIARIQQLMIWINAAALIYLTTNKFNFAFIIYDVIFANIIIISLVFNRCRVCQTPLACRADGNGFFIARIDPSFGPLKRCRKCGHRFGQST